MTFSSNRNDHRWDRRQVLTLGAAGLAFAWSGGRAAAAAPDEPVQLNWLETAEFAPLFAAEKMGFDTALGFKQKFLPGGPQVNAIQAVAGGTARLGFISGIRNIAQARSNGIPVKVVAALCRQSPLGLMSLADKPIKTPADAVGKKVGLPNGARLTWQMMLAANGVSPDQITIVPTGPDAGPLLTGQVDAKWGNATEDMLAIEAQGTKLHIMTGDVVGVPEHFQVLFTTDAALANNRDLVVSWVRSAIQGANYLEGHMEEMAQYISDRAPGLQFKPADNLAQLKALAAYNQPIGKQLPPLAIDGEAAAKAISQLSAAVKLPKPVTLEDIYDPSIYNDASA